VGEHTFDYLGVDQDKGAVGQLRVSFVSFEKVFFSPPLGGRLCASSLKKSAYALFLF
jgi:hypothetical protein